MKIGYDTYKEIVRQNYKNKLLIGELDKTFAALEDADYEVSDAYAESKNTGLLFLTTNEDLFVTKFSKSKIKPDRMGRTKPIVCDLCFTVLPGSMVVHMRCVREFDKHVFSWLVCSNLACSSNVRELTDISLESKKILGETVSIEKKITRLQKHMLVLINTLKLNAIGVMK